MQRVEGPTELWRDSFIDGGMEQFHYGIHLHDQKKLSYVILLNIVWLGIGK